MFSPFTEFWSDQPVLPVIRTLLNLMKLTLSMINLVILEYYPNFYNVLY